jgi:hypothetical protein
MGHESGGGVPDADEASALLLTGGLPATLREYLEVWCADLLCQLTADERASVISIVHCGYGGGPWPSRLQVQRMAEMTAGVITADACIGELINQHCYGIDGAIELLYSDDRDVRDNAVVMLGRYPNTGELVPKVSAALRAGALTDDEFSDICSRALRSPLLPDPIPSPAHLPTVPDDYPESYADYRRREPDFTPGDYEPRSPRVP